MANTESGQLAVVCGLGADLRPEVAKGLLESGMRVVFLGDDQSQLDSIKASTPSTSVDFVQSALDSKDEVDQAFDDIAARFGTPDLLVNVTRMFSEFEQEDLEVADLTKWRSDVAPEPTMVLLTSQAAGRQMQQKGSGRIVNISSDASELCINGDGVGKIMVQGLTVGFARQLGPAGISVNTVAVGAIPGEGDSAAAQSEQALSRPTTIDDVAHAISYFASDLSAGITGQILHVNGGAWMRTV